MHELLNLTMAGNTVVAINTTAVNAEDKDKIKETPHRLRNHSYLQANTSGGGANQNQSNVEVPAEQDTIQEEEETGSKTENDSEMGSMEDITSAKRLLRKEDWQGKTTAFKLDSIFEAVNRMYSYHAQCMEKIKPLEYAVFDAEGGILPQLTKITTHAQSVTDKQSTLEAENAQLRDEMELVKGVITKQRKQIASLQNKLADQTARLMSDHIVIGGILGDSASSGEDECKALAALFLEQQMDIDIEAEEIVAGYRMGRFQENKNRPIVIKVLPQLQRQIFSNTTKLADKLNSKGKPFSVNPLLPDLLAEQRRENRQLIKDKKEAEKGLPKQQKSSFLVRNGTVFINGQAKKKKVLPPDFRGLFVEQDEQLKINRIKTKTVEANPSKEASLKLLRSTLQG